jgi:hypothetical protein
MTPRTYPPPPESDDFDDEPAQATDGDRPVVKHVVRDLAAAVKMRKLQAAAEERSRKAEASADERARKAEARASELQIKADERARKHELRAEIARIRVGMSAVEKARTNIAITSPILLALLIGGYIAALATASIPDEAMSTSAALLTLLCTGLLANLRSVISNEGNVDDMENGKHEDEPPPPKNSKETF